MISRDFRFLTLFVSEVVPSENTGSHDITRAIYERGFEEIKYFSYNTLPASLKYSLTLLKIVLLGVLWSMQAQRPNVKKQAINETHLTVEDEPKVEKLRRHHERQPKLAFLPYVKCAVAGFLSLLLLGCGVFSKLSVIAVAKCDDGSSAKKGRRYIMLVLILMVPQFTSFVTAAWGSIRKKNCPWPTNKAIIFVSMIIFYKYSL